MAAGMPAQWWDVLRSSPLLRGIGAPTLRRLAGGAREVSISAGDTLLSQGDEPDALYLVLGGQLEVALTNVAGDRVTLSVAGPGAVLGEMAVLLGGRRSSTVRATSDARLLRVARADALALLEDDEALVERFNAIVQARLQRLQLASYVSGLFGPLRGEVLDEIEREVEWVSLPTGKILFRHGDDAADGIYIVAGGRLRVVLEQPEGAERPLAEVGRGESVGEMALLGDGVRSATVYAVRDSELARLSREAFDRLMARHPTAMMQIARLLVTRLRRATQGPSRGGRTRRCFAVVPASPGVDLDSFTAELAAALAGYDDALWIDSARVGDALGRVDAAQRPDGDPGSIRLTQWLLEQENAHAVVVYEADPTWSAWTRRAVRHADHVLYVGDARADPKPGAFERRLDDVWQHARVPRRSLVLLQPAAQSAFSGTAAWLEDRDVDGYFHVRRGVREDFARLARLLTGRGIGVVLGGGGARGFAHIGVLLALEELGIPVDAIGGTSMGALIAGLHALGHAPSSLTELCRVHTSRLLDPTLPVVSLIGGHRTGRSLRHVFGRWSIEDLALPFFCVSTNLTRAEEVEHRRGPLGRAVRASISLPGILPPVAAAGDLLIDGGLLNNIPVDVMSRVTGGGPILAVDVSPDVDLRAEIDVGTEVSGWRVFWSRVNPLAERIPAPGILSVLGRSVVVGSIVAQRQRLGSGADELYLPLPVGAFGLLEFKAIDRIVAAGLEASREPLRAWGEALRPRSTATPRRGTATT